MNREPNNPTPGKSRIFVLSAIAAIAAIAGGSTGGILASGVFDALTGYGLPNPLGTFGAILGAIAGGVFTSKYLRKKWNQID